MLEATFLGLWIFGWTSCRPGCHLATIWSRPWAHGFGLLHPHRELVDAAPRRYEIVDGRRSSPASERCCPTPSPVTAWVHTILAGLIFGSMLMLRRRARTSCVAATSSCSATRGEAGTDRRGASDAWSSCRSANRFGEAVTSAQGMKIAASEAQSDDCGPVRFLRLPIGGFSAQDPDPSFAVTIRACCRRWPPVRSVVRSTASTSPGPGGAAVRAGQLHAERAADVLVDAGDRDAGVAMFLIAGRSVAVPQQKLHEARSYQRIAIVRSPSPTSPPRPASILTEMGRRRGSSRTS